MMRIAAIALVALAGCASAPPPVAQTPQTLEAAQVYQSLRVGEVEQRMLYDDGLITYGNAVVSCGLRSPQWFDILRDVYAQDDARELHEVPLNPLQQAQALSYANAHIRNPSPPPYICERLNQDSTLASLDYMIAVKSADIVAAAK